MCVELIKKRLSHDKAQETYLYFERCGKLLWIFRVLSQMGNHRNEKSDVVHKGQGLMYYFFNIIVNIKPPHMKC